MKLEDRFQALERTAAPDLWTEVQGRASNPAPRIESHHSRPLLAAISLAVAFLVIGSSLYALRGVGQGSEQPGFAPGQIARYPVPAAQPLVFGGGAAWVVGSDGGWPELWRVDATTGKSVGLPNTRGGAWPAFGEGYAWVTCSGNRDNPCGGVGVLQLDARTGATLAKIPLVSQPNAIAAGAGSVWITTDLGLVKIDPATASVVATYTPVPHPLYVGVAGGKVWVASNDHPGVVALDPLTGNVAASIRNSAPCALNASDLGVFLQICPAARTGASFLERIDPLGAEVSFTRKLPVGMAGFMTVFSGRLWVAGWSGDGAGAQVSPLDPVSGAPAGAPIAIPSTQPFASGGLGLLPLFIAGGADSLWVTHVDANDVIRIGIRPAGVAQPLPTDTPTYFINGARAAPNANAKTGQGCVQYSADRPDLHICSDKVSPTWVPDPAPYFDKTICEISAEYVNDPKRLSPAAAAHFVLPPEGRGPVVLSTCKIVESLGSPLLDVVFVRNEGRNNVHVEYRR